MEASESSGALCPHCGLGMRTIENPMAGRVIRTLYCHACKREFLEGKEFYQIAQLESELGPIADVSETLEGDM
jgi:uncharacterized protein with PIN domain